MPSRWSRWPAPSYSRSRSIRCRASTRHLTPTGSPRPPSRAGPLSFERRLQPRYRPVPHAALTGKMAPIPDQAIIFDRATVTEMPSKPTVTLIHHARDSRVSVRSLSRSRILVWSPIETLSGIAADDAFSLQTLRILRDRHRRGQSPRAMKTDGSIMKSCSSKDDVGEADREGFGPQPLPLLILVIPRAEVRKMIVAKGMIRRQLLGEDCTLKRRFDGSSWVEVNVTTESLGPPSFASVEDVAPPFLVLVQAPPCLDDRCVLTSIVASRINTVGLDGTAATRSRSVPLRVASVQATQWRMATTLI